MALIWGAFVNLIRAERDGLFSLDQADIDAARDACWSLCTG
jgi:TetR/AcrR family transcriptional regulator, repressor of fatR-cypB operon